MLAAPTDALDSSPLFDETEHAAIDRGNALTLFLRLALTGETVASL